MIYATLFIKIKNWWFIIYFNCYKNIMKLLIKNYKYKKNKNYLKI